jgi:hypothetical protein
MLARRDVRGVLGLTNLTRSSAIALLVSALSKEVNESVGGILYNPPQVRQASKTITVVHRREPLLQELRDFVAQTPNDVWIRL